MTTNPTNKTSDDAAEARSQKGQTSRLRAELLSQRGVVADLVHLADEIREAARNVALAVESVAMTLDSERRGDLSVSARMDGPRVADFVEGYVGNANLTDEGRDSLAERLAAFACELRRRVPIHRMTGHETFREHGRRAAAETARKLGVPDEPAPVGPGVPEPARDTAAHDPRAAGQRKNRDVIPFRRSKARDSKRRKPVRSR